MHAIVVGAGIGGLTLALACRKAGIGVTLLEQAAALKEIGAGIQISSNGTRVLRELNLLEAIDSVGVRPVSFRVSAFESGEVIADFPLGPEAAARYGGTFYQLHRADLLKAGRKEVLVDEAIGLAGRAKAQGADATLELYDKRLHIFSLFPFLPNAAHARFRASLHRRRIAGRRGIDGTVAVRPAVTPVEEGAGGRGRFSSSAPGPSPRSSSAPRRRPAPRRGRSRPPRARAPRGRRA
jgi:hypothetical protein